MSYEKVLELTAAVCGYNYYRKLWQPKPSQTLNCFYEEDNPFDPFAIKVYEVGKSDVVGHLSREISRATKFFLDRGGKVTVTLTSEHYRRSPLVQGGMEIACLMRSSVPGTCVNLLVLERFKAIISENYTEPKEETILGSFLVPTTDENVGATNEDIGVRQIGRNKCKKKAVCSNQPKSKDIRTFFTHQSKQHEIRNESNTRKTDVITID